jgi:hypothetical protein
LGGTCNGRCCCILWPVCLFYGNLVYFVKIWYFMVIWYVLPRVGMLYHEKFCNPDQKLICSNLSSFISVHLPRLQNAPKSKMFVQKHRKNSRRLSFLAGICPKLLAENLCESFFGRNGVL